MKAASRLGGSLHAFARKAAPGFTLAAAAEKSARIYKDAGAFLAYGCIRVGTLRRFLGLVRAS